MRAREHIGVAVVGDRWLLCRKGNSTTCVPAMHRVNDSKYGLQSGVFTHDMDKAWYAFERLDVGGVVLGHVPSIRVDAQVKE